MRSPSSAPQTRGSAIDSPSTWPTLRRRRTTPESYDAALCLGASFVYGSLADTVDALAPAVRPGGHVVVGEPFWRRLPLPEDYEDRHEPWTSLDGTVRIFETSGIPVVSVISSSEDDWDRYETLHWQTVERWLAANPDDSGRGGDPDAIRAREVELSAPPARLPRLGDLRRLEAAVAAASRPSRSGREQPAQHVREDPAVPQVLALARRVEAHDGTELFLIGTHRDLVCLAVLESDDRELLVPRQAQ